MKTNLLIIALIAIGFVANAQNSSPGSTNVSTTGTLTVKATTVTFNGDHAPQNYLAIWVMNVYLKSLTFF